MLRGVLRAPRPACSCERMRRIPSTTRYAAPAYLTTSNATAEASTSEDSPTTANATWISVPVVTPSTEASPAALPWSTLRETMYSTAGPGITSSVSAASTKSPYAVPDGMCESLAHEHLGRRLGRAARGLVGG